MPWLLAFALAAPPPTSLEPVVPLSPAEAARRDALAHYGVGRMLAADDRPASAAKEYEAAARADPASPEPRRPLVAVYADLGRDPAAIRTAREVLARDPADADTAHALGRLLYDGKKFADATKALQQAADSPRLAARPAKWLAVYRDLARAATAAEDFPTAETALKAAATLATDRRADLLRSPAFPTTLDLDREAATIRERLGDAQLAQEKFADASASYSVAAARFADPAGANDPTAAARLHWNLSDVLARKGDPTAALTHLRQFLELGPSSPEPYRRLADLVRRSGAGEPAVRAALVREKAVRPNHSAIDWVLAAEIGRTDPTAAHRLFREQAGTTVDPRFFAIAVRHYRESKQPAGLIELADDLYRAARTAAEAKKGPPPDPTAGDRARAFTTAVRADAEVSRLLLQHAANGGLAGGPDAHAADTWDLIAGLAERDRRLDLAERALRAAGAEAAGDPSFARRLLEVLEKQRKWRDVLRECDRVGDRILGRSAAHLAARARALAELGRPEAVEAAALIAQLGGGLWAQLEKARVLVVLGKYRDAADECERLLKDYPAPADARRIRTLLADARLGLKDFARAEAELRAVLDADPDDTLALNNLGYNLADQSRNLAEAERMIRRAMELDRDERTRAGDPAAENGVYLDSLAWVLFRRGKLPEARALLETAAGLPDAAGDAVVWDHLGDVAFRQGDAERARVAWQEAAKLSADSHTGRQGDRAKEIGRKLKLVGGN